MPDLLPAPTAPPTARLALRREAPRPPGGLLHTPVADNIVGGLGGVAQAGCRLARTGAAVVQAVWERVGCCGFDHVDFLIEILISSYFSSVREKNQRDIFERSSRSKFLLIIFSLQGFKVAQEYFFKKNLGT